MKTVYVVLIFDRYSQSKTMEFVGDTYYNAETYLLDRGYCESGEGEYDLIDHQNGHKEAVIYEYELNKENSILV